MPIPRQWSMIALVLASAHCGTKSETLHQLPCDGAATCTSSGTDAGESTTGDAPTGASTLGTTVDPETTVDPDPSTTTFAEESSSDDTGDTGSADESSSTGEPVDNMYAPCTSHADCTSGYCGGGFCTTVCWSQAEGETPCPPPPAGAVGITITCDRIEFPPEPGSPVCEGCFDCGQYCVAVCDGGSVCPNGSSCLDDQCGGPNDYCG